MLIASTASRGDINSDTPETREIYSAFNLHAFSVRRSGQRQSRDMAGEVIGVLRGDAVATLAHVFESSATGTPASAIADGLDWPPDLRSPGAILMSQIDAVVTRVIEYWPISDFWMVEVEVMVDGQSALISPRAQNARPAIQPGDTVLIPVVSLDSDFADEDELPF
jgi:hypothetical protein